MSWQSATPIEIAVSGPKLEESYAFAEKIRKRLESISSLRDLQYGQSLDYPTLTITVDREKLGRMGGTVREFTDSTVAFTSSSRYLVPLFWPDPKTGIGFQVQVEVPADRVKGEADVGLVQIGTDSEGRPIRLRDVAHVERRVMPGEFDRYNMRRLVSLNANIHGEDLGRVAGDIARAVKEVGEPPRDVQVDVRGQIVPMRELFGSLALGLILAVVVIFLLLTGYFQAVRLALVVILTAPAVLIGVALALIVTRTTLNVQSFMGATMALGVAVANAILLATFAERGRQGGMSAAAAAEDGAKHRLRPILMTSFAMIAGMMPLALALGEGGEQTAPLGRAVIGGLIAATLTTLLVLPALFTLLQSRAAVGTGSLDPDDPTSTYWKPEKPS